MSHLSLTLGELSQIRPLTVELLQLHRNVSSMTRAQRKYFASRDPKDLRQAKHCEQVVQSQQTQIDIRYQELIEQLEGACTPK
jgi:phosphate uptake regulator